MPFNPDHARLRLIPEESFVQMAFPAIEFRDGVTGRRASLRGGPDVWEIVMVQRDYGTDRDGLYEHFRWIPRQDVDQALAYAKEFSSSVNARVDENERLGRQLAEGSTRSAPRRG